MLSPAASGGEGLQLSNEKGRGGVETFPSKCPKKGELMKDKLNYEIIWNDKDACKKLNHISENHIHDWEQCDEYGWRQIYLIRQGKDLMLVAYGKDGEEVEPNV